MGQGVDTRRTMFDAAVGRHLDAAYNLARWLAGNGPDAEDVAQEALLRAYRYFDSWHGGDARAWLLTIVRNTHRTWTKEHARAPVATDFANEEGFLQQQFDQAPHPEARLLNRENRLRLSRVIAELPTELREVIVLRDLQELSFREVAAITNAPVTTVQSRLDRARALVRERWPADGERAP